MAKIAFIGLGNMGAPMEVNLLKAGHKVCVFDLMPDMVKNLVSQGASTAASAKAAVAGKDFVISMLPAGQHVESVYLGNGDDSGDGSGDGSGDDSGDSNSGVLSVLDKNTVVIDSSTIDVATAQKVATKANEMGISMMDCPVSGGVAAASAGTLSFMCGGSEAVFDQVKVVLASMGKNIFHAGLHGAGQVAKMCNNMLLSIHMIGTAEALKLGVDNGLDPSVLSEIMLASSGRNWSLEVYNPYPGVMKESPASNDYRPGFMVNLMCKDLGLAMEAAQASNSATPLGALAQKLYLDHANEGHGEKDFSSILNSLV